MSESTAPGIQISHYTERSPDHDVNEDLILTGEKFVVVLDGATHHPAVTDNGCIHDVRWLVHKLGVQLVSRLLDETDEPLPEVLAAAISGVRDLHADTCDLTNPDSPSSTVALLRRRGQLVDYLVLADCSIAFRKHNHSILHFTDDRVDHLPDYSVETVREMRNCPGGFWVASTKPEAAYEAVTGTIDLNHGDIQSAGLFTDGAAGLVERHEGTWAETMRILESGRGPQQLIEKVRELDEKEPGGTRGKRHDDATAAVCWFPGSAHGRATVLSNKEVFSLL
jgi:hypothetical protein